MQSPAKNDSRTGQELSVGDRLRTSPDCSSTAPLGYAECGPRVARVEKRSIGWHSKKRVLPGIAQEALRRAITPKEPHPCHCHCRLFDGVVDARLDAVELLSRFVIRAAQAAHVMPLTASVTVVVDIWSWSVVMMGGS